MTIIDQVISKLCNWRGEPYTKKDIIWYCGWEIEQNGINATKEFWMRGKQGEGTKKTRRLFPQGPVGIVVREGYGSLLEGFLRVSFYCKDLLLFVDDISGLESAVVKYLINNAAHHLAQPSLTDLIALRSLICEVEVDDDVLLELLDFANGIYQPGAYLLVINGLLMMDRFAQARGWKSITKNNRHVPNAIKWYIG